MHPLRGPQLPHAEGDARRRPAGAEEVLPQGAQAHAAQGIAEEVKDEGRRMKDEKDEDMPLRLFSSFILLPSSFGRGVAQLVEQPSPKRQVERSSRSAPARFSAASSARRGKQ